MQIKLTPYNQSSETMWNKLEQETPDDKHSFQKKKKNNDEHSFFNQYDEHSFFQILQRWIFLCTRITQSSSIKINLKALLVTSVFSCGLNRYGK